MSLITWIMRGAVAALYVRQEDWSRDLRSPSRVKINLKAIHYALIMLLTRPRKTILPVRGCSWLTTYSPDGKFASDLNLPR
jgi:hypothetical protein